MPGLYWFTKILKYVVAIRHLLGVLVMWVIWLCGIVQFLVVDGFAKLVGYLDEFPDAVGGAGGGGTFEPTSLNGIEWVGRINAIIPLSEVVALLVSYYAAWLLVILIRWAKSFIPTMAN